MPIFDPSRYQTQETRALPVLLLIDVSGSMEGEKINTVNECMRKMLASFSDNSAEVPISVAMITFGDQVRLHIPFTPSAKIEWQDLTAYGMTPMGLALRMAKDMIQDPEIIPSKSYRPTVVLIWFLNDSFPNSSIHFFPNTEECAYIALQELTSIFQINICEKFTRNNTKIRIVITLITQVCL